MACLMCSSQPLKLSMFIVLSLMLLYGASNIQCSTVLQNSTDMLSLLEFRQAISDPRGVLKSWNSSIDYCKWNGVTCGGRRHPRRVTRLKLAGQSFEGQIPPNLGNLTFLLYLNLSSNGFFGQLPILNHLKRLQVLDLSKNNLQGSLVALPNTSNLQYLDLSTNLLMGPISPNVGSLLNLRYLNLASNEFTGSISPSIGFLSNILFLHLNKNKFTGIIPSSLQNITLLQMLDLSENQLEGTIPEELGQLSNMVQLSLWGNRLSGAVPIAIFNSSVLQSLDLHSNLLYMELPSNIGNNLPVFSDIHLYGNMFHGPIPASLGNASLLQIIDLSSNYFIGQVPSSLGNLSSLEFLKLAENKLEANNRQSWKFLDALSNCRSLQFLSLSDNQLQGPIPNSIGNLSTGLQQLSLSRNSLSGIVPESVGNLPNLTVLLLDQNNLTGPIGAWIGKLKNLGTLNLGDNSFTGAIPSSIGSLTQLTLLFLQSNKFEGPIPPSLGNLPSLLELNLSYNNLQSHIPKELFRQVSTITKFTLSYNNLEGPIPQEVSNLNQLNQLHLSSNMLTGEIPGTLGECEQLQILQMDHNFLTGNIPNSLGSLKSLTIANISHNNLSGFIPIELSRLPSLTQLDLSYNDLQGVIPKDGVFGNPRTVYVGGNPGLCGGVSDLHMPSCPATSGRKMTQYYLIRVLIPIFGFMSLVLLIYFIVTEKKMKRGSFFSFSPLGDQFPKVSYQDLAQATQNFSESNLIGRGSYGSVYRGKLIKGKQEVAVKVLNLEMRDAEKSFLSECEALRGIRHRNLVQIKTACSTVDIQGNVFKALIYDFMPNGNLDSWLHQKGDEKLRKPLNLIQRTSLALNIADALDYLHHESGQTIIHCDVKPSNILLDDDMNAHLGDFGIASFYIDSGSTSTGDSNTTSIGVKGTIGYIAPGISFERTPYTSTLLSLLHMSRLSSSSELAVYILLDVEAEF